MEPLIQYSQSKDTNVDTYELEARFGHQLNKLDYNHVIQWLLLSGFVLEDPVGKDILRIGYKKTTENVRIEITGIKPIQRYCKTQQLVNPLFSKKKQVSRHEIPLYWTTIALSIESTMTEEEQKTFIPSSYRFMNRVRLTSKEHAFYYDCSIVRTSDTLSSLFTKDPSYEIECEFVDKKNLPGQLEKAITFALRGLQQSYYPISFKEMNDVKAEYKKQIATGSFIGPNLVTLQEDNLHGTMSIYNKHAVTEKADGERKLLFVCKDKIYYLVGSSLEVQWTGSTVEGCNGTLLDGEHVIHSRDRARINAYFAFDIYFHKLKALVDVRAEPFMVTEDADNRYSRLQDAIDKLNAKRKPTFVLDYKKFMIGSHASCKELLEKSKRSTDEDGFPYHIDGLIFTPMSYGVGMTDKDKTVKDRQITWDLNFKWKPAEENTVDFLIQFEDKEYVHADPANPFTYKIVQLFVQFGPFDIDANPQQSIFQGYETNPPRDSSLVLFKPTEPLNEIGAPIDEQSHLAYIPSMDGVLYSELREVLEPNMSVECRYDKDRRWIPMRVRWDKMKNRNPNAFRTAASNWYTIHRPITEAMLTAPYQSEQYYEENREESALRKFHNHVKTQLLTIIKPKEIVLDFAVGRGGDLFKWSKASFVLGIDIDENNIVNKKWGACKRYLEAWNNKTQPYRTKALFVQGNSTLRIKTGDAMRGLKEKAVVRSVFGVDPKRSLAKGVDVHYGKGAKGFHVTSIQFAVHYMFGNKRDLSHFLQNVAECTAMHGYFVGTCYDGMSVFTKLKEKSEGEMYVIPDICTIRKKYNHMDADMNDSCLGYKIGVKQKSIGSEHDEFLVFFPFFVRLMEEYGFEEVEVKPFQRWYDDWGKKMTPGEQELSFLNRSFIFQKKREVFLATKEYYIAI